MSRKNRYTLADRVIKAAEAALATQDYVSPIEVLVGIGWLDPGSVERWRRGQIGCLERVVQTNLPRISEAMKLFRSWATGRGLFASPTHYVTARHDARRCASAEAETLRSRGSPEAIVAAAKKAEEVGFDAIFVNDHIIVDGSPRAAPWTNVYDPFVAMSFIAAHTARIGVGVSVLIMPYRNPIATAKSLATIDRMSGGRLIAGVGAGWNEAEFAALGVPFRERGPRTNEYLRLWQACWSPGKVSFAGRFFSFADMHVSPKPVQQPYPPIWVGGTSDAALHRAARFAALWQPTPLPIAELVERQNVLRQACDKIGRVPIPTRMSFRVEFSNITGNEPQSGSRRPVGHGTPAEVAGDLLSYREKAGLDAFQINFHGNRNLDQLLQSMECFMQDVAPLVADQRIRSGN